MFEVGVYSKGTFVTFLSNHTDPNYVTRKPIVSYLNKFFLSNPNLQERDIVYVVENYYVSQSYKDDLLVYHTASFRNFEKFCKRIHLFIKTDYLSFIDNPSFEHFLNNKKDNDAWMLYSSYLGYVVIKPVEKTPVGVVLAKPWEEVDSTGTKVVKSLVEERVNFFGRTIKFNALVMQPQDPSVTICSVNAVWCILHYAWKNFKTPMVSPAKISQRAGMSIDDGRLYPIGDRKGFNTAQVCSTLKSFDLQPEIFDFSKNKFELTHLKRLIYAYNKSGFPLLLGYRFPGDPENIVNKNEVHLVAVCGHKITDIQSLPKDVLPLKAYGITEIVVHDDQLGPYVSIKADGDMGVKGEPIWVHGIWDSTDKKSNRDSLPADVITLIVPLPESIRIRFEIVEEVVKKLNYILQKSFESLKVKNVDVTNDNYKFLKNFQSKFEKQEWNIYLTKAIDYKTKINEIDDNDIIDGVKYAVASTSYPEFIWIASVEIDNRRQVDLIFDTTGAPEGDCLLQIIFFNEIYKQQTLAVLKGVEAVLNNEKIADTVKKKIPKRLVNFINEHIKEQTNIKSYSEFSFNYYHMFTKA